MFNMLRKPHKLLYATGNSPVDFEALGIVDTVRDGLGVARAKLRTLPEDVVATFIMVVIDDEKREDVETTPRIRLSGDQKSVLLYIEDFLKL
jgi:hypothetical protein